MADPRLDALVVGSGPNGLAAAITLARAGKSVRVVEGQPTIGGGTRSDALTLPGFVHDVCSAIHPLAAGSPFFQTLPLSRLGLDLVQPGAPLVHPLDGGRAVVIERSVDATAAGLGSDGPAYARLMSPLVKQHVIVMRDLFAPLRPSRHPLIMARFGLHALRSAASLARGRFTNDGTRAAFAGMAAHSMLPLTSAATAAVALVLGMLAHAYGWPIARGGSAYIPEALATHLRALGGQIETSTWVESADRMPDARTVLFDVAPHALVTIAGNRFPAGFRGALERFRYGPGVFKLDWALDGPIPWQAPACARAGTVHLGGSFAEVMESEATVGRGQAAEHPFVLLAQQSLFDPTRAPTGKHTGWAYCHLPSGSTVDMTDRIEAQVERFAPGFKKRILARHVFSPADVERYNPNFVGGDINCGLADLRQLFIRPTPRLYSTPDRQLYICSAATPPGGGVHGMCGVFAARAALRRARWA